MHMHINAIVYADSDDAALQTAKQNVFAPLVVTQNAYNICVTMDVGTRLVTATPDRYDIPAVVRADSDIGQQLIDDAFQQMVAAWQEAIDRIQLYLEETDPRDFWEYESANQTIIRVGFQMLGAFRGFPIQLYDHYGNGIRTRERLDTVLDKQLDGELRDEQPHADQTVYVVPADAY